MTENKNIKKLSEKEKQVLLAMTMESIRGSWSDPKERIEIIKTLCDTIQELPTTYLNAVKNNASQFDGEFIDGRIFRDGSRESGLSGNLAFHITGDDRINQRGYYGTYEELWTILKETPEIEKIKIKVYNSVLRFTSDLSWDDLYREETAEITGNVTEATHSGV